ncbi:MAG: D-alanyl-D-alanine carboxypeptidase [Erysipelotrichaceae bacterium]|nr:D-alanyl-D-alanine carboxypeptidase [Erysipelotrichaceae bacterium]
MKKIVMTMIVCLSLLWSQVIRPQAVDLPFTLEAEYVYMINIDTDEIIYEKNAYDKMYPASMTKIMSAIVAIEAIDDLHQTITITPKMMAGLYEANASMAGFNVYDEVTYEDLLYGVMLPSGAECTQALAYSLFGSEEAFVAAMNDKAQALGMDNTHFVNTTGLHDANHYSTCYDLSLLLRYAIQDPTFYQIFTTKEYISTNGLKMRSSSLSYLGKGAHMVGGKTGFTNPAGRCLASISQGNERYMIILGKAPNDAAISKALVESNQLYDYIYDNYHYEMLYAQDEIIKEVHVKYSLSNYEYAIKAPTDMGLTTYNDYTLEVKIPDELIAPLNEGDELGKIVVKGADGMESTFVIVANETIETNVLIKLFWPVLVFSLENPHAMINIIIIAVLLIIIYRLAKGMNKNKPKVKNKC